MKFADLLTRLQRGLLAMLALLLLVLALMVAEMLLTDASAPWQIHGLQFGAFVPLLGLVFVVWRVKAHLRQAIRSELGMLQDQVKSQASQINAITRQMTDIVEVSPDLVWVKDLQGVYQSSNLAFAHYIGRDPAQIIGCTDFDLTTPEQAEAFRAHDRQTLASRTSTRIEERHTPAQGGPVQLYEIIKSPVLGPDGEIIGVQGVGRNITERRAAELALAQANEQRHILELCIAKLNDVVVITEAEPLEAPGPRMVFVNDAFERMTGYSRAEALGQSPCLLQGPKTNRSELTRIHEALRQWHPVHAELLNYKKTGELFWVELDITPVANAAGWFTHWIAIQRDITDRKAADAELLHVCDRALEASRLKSEFLSTISHEMRTPMNGVIGMAQVLQGTTLDVQQQMYLRHILTAAQDYMQVIDKALDFSKLDAGQLPLVNEPFALAPLLHQCEMQMAPKAAAKQLQWSCQLDAAVPTQLLGDARRLQQCLMLLLDNAVKFTIQGSIALMVQRVVPATGSPCVRFEVRDTGKGVSETERERLFQPFVQGDGSVRRKYGGVGLGLVICERLVGMMQGQIGVDSVPGQGSTFWFEVPLRSA